MKYSDVTLSAPNTTAYSNGSLMSNKSLVDPNNYEDLENSIVDSLSEISIASNLPLNVQNQDLLNRTINEVVSLYLWSSDFTTTTMPNLSSSVSSSSSSSYILANDSAAPDKRSKSKARPAFENEDKFSNAKVMTAWEAESNKLQSQQRQPSYSNARKLGKEPNANGSPPEDELFDSKSPKKMAQKKNQMIISSSSYGYPVAKEDKSSTFMTTSNSSSSSKLVVPVLDFSYLQQEKQQLAKQASGEHDDHLDNGSKSANKMLAKQKPAHESSNNTVVMSNFSAKSNTNNGKLRNEINLHQQQPHIKYEIENLLRELKLFKNPNSDYNEYYDQENENKLMKNESEKLNAMALTLKELLSRLLDKRKAAKRTKNVDAMSRDEVQAEKIETQKELLAFEEKFGRPQTKLEKDLMRPLYDHYRKVKRLLAKNQSSNSKANEHGGDGDEHHSSHNQTPPNIDMDVEHENLKDHKHFLNLHSLTLAELTKEKDLTIQEKIRLKDVIKKFELESNGTTKNTVNGSKHLQISRDDRESHKEDFERYKILKAKLKLIDALIDKHEYAKK